MEIWHQFASGKTDASDTTLVLASDWNRVALGGVQAVNRSGVTLNPGDVVALVADTTAGTGLAAILTTSLAAHVWAVCLGAMPSSGSKTVGATVTDGSPGIFGLFGVHPTRVTLPVNHGDGLTKSETTAAALKPRVNTSYALLATALATQTGTGTAVVPCLWFAHPGFYVVWDRAVAAGTGLTGGGDLSQDRTVALSTPVAVAHGGTGATTAAGAKANLLAQGNLRNITLITTSGTWNKPADTVRLIVEAVGGGGSGFNLGDGNSGGGCSGAAAMVYVDATSISSLSITIGAGGVGGTGGTTTVSAGTALSVSCPGGPSTNSGLGPLSTVSGTAVLYQFTIRGVVGVGNYGGGGNSFFNGITAHDRSSPYFGGGGGPNGSGGPGAVRIWEFW